MDKDGAAARRVRFRGKAGTLTGIARATKRRHLRFPFTPPLPEGGNTSRVSDSGVFPMPGAAAIEIGQQYRENNNSFLGAQMPTWRVEDLFKATDGLLYARLVSAIDTTERKTLGVAVLTDRRRFRPVRIE